MEQWREGERLPDFKRWASAELRSDEVEITATYISFLGERRNINETRRGT
jgi:hypothetical protein